MKRLSKKLIALVMAMTMVLAMGVTSFAAENTTYSVTINGTPYSVTAPTSKMCDQVSNSENATVITAGDILLKAIEQRTNKTVAQLIQENQLVLGWDQNNLVNGKAGLYISKVGNQAESTTYYWLNPDTYEDDGYYEYEYDGSYWSLGINGDYASYYVSHYLPEEIGTGITFDYIESNFTFTRTTPIDGAIEK